MDLRNDGNVFNIRRRLMKYKNVILLAFLAILIATFIAVGITIIITFTSKRKPDTHDEIVEVTTTRKQILEIPKCISHEGSTTNLLDRANCILSSYPLIDGHNGIAWKYWESTNNRVNFANLKTDIPRLRIGKIGAQFWACYVDCISQYKDAVSRSLNQLDTIKRFINKYPDVFQFVTTAQGIVTLSGILNAFKGGKIGSLVGLEGGHSIDSSLANLRMFYDLGVRYMTLTHDCSTPWADNWRVDEPNCNQTVLNGITEFGKKIILEMNRLGMMVDLSQVSKKTMIDVLNITKAPVIYSHSSVFTICPNYRNVQDDVLRMTRKNGGVVMVNFYDKVINCGPSETSVTVLSQVADHIDYIRHLIGVDYVGIGADYDGVPT
ncbi:hypothetical protein CHS0354_009336 [Potamilus streckersoni]|uniref:Dipeptidase n=1 Tax=Potamilus streckersoni TaxID=2493646 RepID=A0AAE0SNL2_9BIVA|nr:hypothetical protein CHS0354_009336 [Potamilus streckersoni]